MYSNIQLIEHWFQCYSFRQHMGYYCNITPTSWTCVFKYEDFCVVCFSTFTFTLVPLSPFATQYIPSLCQIWTFEIHVSVISWFNCTSYLCRVTCSLKSVFSCTYRKWISTCIREYILKPSYKVSFIKARPYMERMIRSMKTKHLECITA
mgnify:CR=1 FL=1